ncbi:STAS domain-containing protein [Streptomyces capoamus]|uniref:STAS domain-containing protein n=1 Tax=Streptomyces capoamus TaxID=68183 RepID=UPI003C2F529C
MNDFTVVTHRDTDHTLITVHGDMDLQTCPELARAALGVQPSGKPLFLDLSGVPFMDSSGLNLLVLLRRRLLAEGGLLAVTGLQSQPVRLLQLTETYDLFAADTRAAAGSDQALTV